jgi:hypothetical protein
MFYAHFNASKVLLYDIYPLYGRCECVQRGGVLENTVLLGIVRYTIPSTQAAITHETSSARLW